MKIDPAYSREKIQKYLKFKKNDRNTSNTNIQTSKSIDQEPPINKSCMAVLGQSQAETKRWILNRFDEVKQKYPKKGEKKKEEQNTQTSTKQHQNSLTWQHNKKSEVKAQQKHDIIIQKSNKQVNNSNHQQQHVQIEQFIRNMGKNEHKSSIVHDIIVKRIQESFIESLSTQTSQQKEQRDDHLIESDVIHNEAYNKALKLCINIPFDQEYTDTSISSAQKIIIPAKSRSIQQQTTLWMHSPHTLISSIMNIHTQPSDFVLTSTNKTFSPTIAQLINQFILKGKCSMKQGQKQALYHIGIQYFYGNASELTPELLVILIKLGKRYLVQNSQYFTMNTQRYCKIILNNRSLFTMQERAYVVNFLVQQTILKYQELGCLLMVLPTQKLILSMLNKQFSKSQTIFLLACLNLSRKEFNHLTEPYLRLICLLIDGIALDKMLIEEMLAHVGQIVPGDSYQAHKHTKLKLIKLLSEGQGSNQNKIKKDENTSSKIIGYWSKAVDKIKIATQLKE